MTDEIIHQVPGITIYRTTDLGPPVPYPQAPRDDSVNHGFLDLRDQPRLVDGIPEAKQSEGLREVLRALNEQGSDLMSLGCERKLNRRDEEPTYYFHSYTDFTARDPSRNSTEAQMIDVARQILEQFWHGRPQIIFSVEVGVQKMKHFFGGVGFNINLGLSGYGPSEFEALAAYEKLADAMADAIRKRDR
ncbi:hypothetical protein LJR234_004604 [Mesorhizobium amorphae]|uniref:hypothetical protein n=1 Tax=Mesorhizobium amorphae TaxID=71433 RepID=UPI003ECEE3FA